MERLKPKISIIGCGNVGMRYAYALIFKGIARKIVMIDINKDRLEGDVMDLLHAAPFVTPVEIIAGDYKDITDSDLIVITAGKKQKQGQSRLDIAKDNVDLFRVLIPHITEYAKSSIFLVVSNPVDILSYATFKFSNKKPNEIIGSGTVLDSARLRYQLSSYFNVDPRNVHAYILGEHGDSEVPIWSKAMIGGYLMGDYFKTDTYCKFDNYSNLRNIFENVRDSAYQIIGKKGETSYGIGLSLIRITNAILNDENAILPISCLVNNYLGIDNVYLSMPAVLNKNGVREILYLDLNNEEIKNLINSARILRKMLKKLDFY